MNVQKSPFLPLLLTGFAAVGSACAQLPILGPAPVSPNVTKRAQVEAAVATSAGAQGLSVDISTRQNSLIFYRTNYLPSSGVASGWTGNIQSGVAGTTSQTYRDATARRVNYFRAMAGVPAAIVFSDSYNAMDQLAALMMSANTNLSHTPTASWVDYTPDGATASNSSNLALGNEGPSAIDVYLVDDGSGNDAVGHRRWLLYPQTLTMGTGDVDGSGWPADPYYYAANALWVIDSNFSNPRPAVRDNFVAWPPPGYTPYNLVPARWSISYPNADFSQVQVTMTNSSGANVPVTYEQVHTGYAENTLVWLPQGVTLKADVPVAGQPIEQQEQNFHVVISNILIGGAATTFTYDVKTFDPEQAGTGQGPTFFAAESSLGQGAYYLSLPNTNIFGYYAYLNTAGFLYHFDMGYEYYIDARDGHSGVYLYDFKSNDWMYTSPSFAFPYLYDFTLNTVLYYYPDPTNAGRYNTNGVRYFYRYDTGKIISR